MGRWKPPAKSSSPYITPAGAETLKGELRTLWRETRPEVVRALAAAAAEGDRSENAEYTYRKKQLGGIDRRIRYLTKRLDVIRVVDRPPADPTVVRFGAWVSLRGADGDAVTYRIVGADETNGERGWISIDSPLARALLGKMLGAEVTALLPSGERAFEILDIRYED